MLETDDAEIAVQPSAHVEDPAARLLPQCLDLQLDALLLTLGALAASSSSAQAPSPGGTAGAGEVEPADGEAPWRRWLLEDVDLAAALAAGMLAEGTPLPPALGSDLAHAVPAATIDELIARYTAIRALLADPASPGDAGGRAVEHCDARLAELRAHRLIETPASGLALRADRSFLPGELLG